MRLHEFTKQITSWATQFFHITLQPPKPAPPYQVRLQTVKQFSLFQNIYFQQHSRRQMQWFQYIALTLWFKKQQLCYSIFLNGDKRTELYYLELILTPELYYPEIILTSELYHPEIIPTQSINNRAQGRFPSKFQNFSQLKDHSLRPHPLAHTVWTLKFIIR